MLINPLMNYGVLLFVRLFVFIIEKGSHRQQRKLTYFTAYMHEAGVIHSRAWIPQLMRNDGLPSPPLLICNVTYSSKIPFEYFHFKIIRSRVRSIYL